MWLTSKARYHKARQTCAHRDEDVCEYEDLTKTKIKVKVVCFKVEPRIEIKLHGARRRKAGSGFAKL